MVTSNQLTPLFSLHASSQAIFWVAGPVITTFAGTQVGTREAIRLAAAFLVNGGIWFIALPEIGRLHLATTEI
jgi:hypothetical protein